jgi:BASS family bile acid:Na+ symporter
MTKSTIHKAGYITTVVLLMAYIAISFSVYSNFAGLLLTGFFISLAVDFQGITKLKGFSYTIMIFGAVAAAMYYPQYFIHIGSFKLSGLIIPLLQVIMFGMGSELSLKELAAVAKTPKKIGVGLLCHYTIMPLVGFALANLFNFPKEIAAGIILVGCCPSGVASNVMAYLGRANLALSVAVTSISTLLAPLLTPLLMRLLAGKFVPVDFWAMAWDTTRVVLIPVIAGLLFHVLLRGKVKWLDRIMPLISMIGIGVIIIIIIASGRDSLLKVGLLLILVVFIHNITGFTLGYWISRLLGFEERDCRTICIEVGMQNSGLASGLALLMGGMATIGLAPAIFGPVMNVSGSTLATWWHGRVPEESLNSNLKN